MSFRAVAYQRKPQDAGVGARVAQTHAEAMEEFVAGELETLEAIPIRWTVGTVGVAAGLSWRS